MTSPTAQHAQSSDPAAEIARLRRLALVDPLTRTANRRAFLERMQEAVARAQDGGPLLYI